MALFTSIVLLAAAYPVLLIVYNLYFHPLRRFPGPFWNRVSVWPKHYWSTKGEIIFRVREWHDKYGPVVRIAPGQLVFKDARAWKDIYGRRAAEGRYELPTYTRHYDPMERPPSIISSERELHDSIRKTISPAFSDKAIRAQERHIGQYVDLLVDKLSDQCKAGPSRVNMADWMAFCTFDIIGNLTFGSDFGCLTSGKYPPWIKSIMDSLREFTVVRAFTELGLLPFLKFLIFKVGVGLTAFERQDKHTADKMNERLEMGTDRDDFMDDLIKSGIDTSLLHQNVRLFVLAGSETSATLLAGAIYLLATHPDVYKKWKDEVRETFQDESEITLLSVNKLDYMLAMLKEALRIYPPVAGGPPRIVPKGGTEIAGHFVPEGTNVSIWQWAVNYDESYFVDAHSFEPERCLHRANIIKNSDEGDDTENDKVDQSKISKKYANDRMDVLNPFLVGPRNCIGQNLAYAEMRLILARLAFRFDFELCEESEGWIERQKNYSLWEKPDLFVRLTETTP